uniref:Uncharacterized protein n=1 Tax=Rhizophora mucronata TaxID=61149 RepID=A0A2P2M1Z5_RHIMU
MVCEIECVDLPCVLVPTRIIVMLLMARGLLFKQLKAVNPRSLTFHQLWLNPLFSALSFPLTSVIFSSFMDGHLIDQEKANVGKKKKKIFFVEVI